MMYDEFAPSKEISTKVTPELSLQEIDSIPEVSDTRSNVMRQIFLAIQDPTLWRNEERVIYKPSRNFKCDSLGIRLGMVEVKDGEETVDSLRLTVFVPPDTREEYTIFNRNNRQVDITPTDDEIEALLEFHARLEVIAWDERNQYLVDRRNKDLADAAAALILAKNPPPEPIQPPLTWRDRVTLLLDRWFPKS